MFYDRTINHRINHVHESALRIAYKDHGNDFGYLLEQSNSVPIHTEPAVANDGNLQNKIPSKSTFHEGHFLGTKYEL